jgi:hypothetical protein
MWQVAHLALPKKSSWPRSSAGVARRGSSLPSIPSFGGRWEVEQFLELGHEGDLRGPVEVVHPLLGGDHVIPVEVGPALLELGEALDAPQRPLRAEEALDTDAPQHWRVDPVAVRLGADVRGQVRRPVRVAVGVAVEAGDPPGRPGGASVLGRVELLLRERGDEQPQPLELLGIEDAVEGLEVVREGDDLPPRDVAQVRAGRQVYGGNSGRKWSGRSKSR